jgi:hypothetical protein
VCAPSDEVQIGCYRHPIDYWLEHYAAIGSKEGYGDQKIQEYGILLNVTKQWIDLILKPAASEGKEKQSATS